MAVQFSTVLSASSHSDTKKGGKQQPECVFTLDDSPVMLLCCFSPHMSPTALSFFDTVGPWAVYLAVSTSPAGCPTWGETCPALIVFPCLARWGTHTCTSALPPPEIVEDLTKLWNGRINKGSPRVYCQFSWFGELQYMFKVLNVTREHLSWPLVFKQGVRLLCCPNTCVTN